MSEEKERVNLSNDSLKKVNGGVVIQNEDGSMIVMSDPRKPNWVGVDPQKWEELMKNE